MNWQLFLPLAVVVAAVVVFIWRSAGKTSGGCGSNCGCGHEAHSGPKKEDAVR